MEFEGKKIENLFTASSVDDPTIDFLVAFSAVMLSIMEAHFIGDELGVNANLVKAKYIAHSNLQQCTKLGSSTIM